MFSLLQHAPDLAVKFLVQYAQVQAWWKTNVRKDAHTRGSGGSRLSSASREPSVSATGTPPSSSETPSTEKLSSVPVASPGSLEGLPLGAPPFVSLGGGALGIPQGTESAGSRQEGSSRASVLSRGTEGVGPGDDDDDCSEPGDWEPSSGLHEELQDIDVAPEVASMLRVASAFQQQQHSQLKQPALHPQPEPEQHLLPRRSQVGSMDSILEAAEPAWNEAEPEERTQQRV